ncbi:MULTISPECIES: phosphate signaling complex protein PhoU [unclassified Hahella]|uniref:phosphate signaling complex protein PhoU n=1 Tax=unclassified Hahella TaxID=2624107 RepID=UPI000FDEA1F3|nr:MULTISPECIES: phosphate signaling complex protein PhoU [unclassified Hahella]AZZ90216.1 phosphate signaling complex protein PhoU [Hahella sp. KA22]MBU6954699.1 phosphate signaling complex protein PhoU [Hahella sp. HN01]MDG9668906.1 phosphate signaling complex protein PhoU [Hahella sp. CR1]QAY53586.1 phosphate signaling complex protein PhoU [Hahella sp. KA22]
MANSDVHLQHISQQFNVDLRELRNHVLVMGGLVEKQVADAVEALVRGDSELAEMVRQNDNDVDKLEITIDEECTRVIAKRQPTASDLRLVVAIAKMVNDLERIGDESEKIAKNALQLLEEGEAPRGYVEVRHIGSHVGKMVHDALDAFARFDLDLAFEVMKEDKSVDIEYKTAMRSLVTFMMEDPRSISRILSVMWVLRALERIGDHARNICEHVIFMVKGKDVRHASLEKTEKLIERS